MKMDREWPWQCFVIWYFTLFLAVLAHLSSDPGNDYLAGLCVMAFVHYLGVNNA